MEAPKASRVCWLTVELTKGLLTRLAFQAKWSRSLFWKFVIQLDGGCDGMFARRLQVLGFKAKITALVATCVELEQGAPQLCISGADY